MLKEIIGKGYYSFEQHFDDWQEAIRAGYRTLLEAGVVEDIYVQAVIDCVNKYGPYIVIVPDIAMPHSTEGAKGCHGTATVDHEQHLHNIQELMDALMNEELVNALLEAHTVEELQQAAQTYEA